MGRKILGNTCKLWKRKEASASGFRGRTGILEGIDENLGIGTEVCHGDEGENTENYVPFSLGSQRLGEGDRGEGLGAEHQVEELQGFKID